MVTRGFAKIVVLGTALTACELTDVTVPSGESVVVVHSVLSVGQTTQFVILERSLTGDPSGLVHTGLVPPAPAGAGTPIEGATVTLTHIDPRGCATPTVLLAEQPRVDVGFGPLPSGTYATSELCPLEPGDRIDLRVQTVEGDVVTGATIVPGARSIVVRADEVAANITLQRRTDSLHIDVDPISARALAIELGRDQSRTPSAFSNNLLSIATDTMGVVLDGAMVTFDDDDDHGHAVFQPGRYYTLSVAVTDTNYFDFVRSFSDPLTGRGFINHIDGGVGVFGSVFTNDYDVRVVDVQLDSREGEYHIGGTFNGTPVDMVLDVYLAPLSDNGRFSAFVDGTWVDGPLGTSADGSYGFNAASPGSSVGDFSAEFLTMGFGPDSVFYRLTGTPAAPTRPFDVEVIAMVGPDVVAIDTLSALPMTAASSRR